MSRIDEALRRAGKVTSATGHKDNIPLDQPVADAAALERYATERPPEPVREGRRQLHVLPADHREERAPWSPSNPGFESKLVLGHRIPQVAVERYRRLAAVLHDFRLQHGLTRLMVSSALPREGKTLTAVNLALTLSESYHQKVLLIDADLRRPSIHEVLGIPNRSGLSDLVLTGGKVGRAVEVSRCLHVLTAGHPQANPLAMLTSERVSMLVEEAAKEFDWVLLDTPPIGLLPDAQLVARLSEGVIFVIAAGVTPYQVIRKSIDQIGKDRIVGTVLNRVKAENLPNEAYGGYYTSNR